MVVCFKLFNFSQNETNNILCYLLASCTVIQTIGGKRRGLSTYYILDRTFCYKSSKTGSFLTIALIFIHIKTSGV